MYAVYAEDLERKRIIRSFQRVLLNGMVFAALLVAVGIIGTVVFGASLSEASIAVLTEPPKLTR